MTPARRSTTARGGNRSRPGQPQIPPDALPAALAALRRFREAEPAHAAWITAGAPTMTEAEHVERFGVPYKTSR